MSDDLIVLESLVSRPTPPFDPSKLTQLRMLESMSGKPGLILNLFAMFQTQGPERLEKIRGAYRTLDFAVIEFEAHALKSVGGNLGAVELMWWAGQLEEHSKAQDTSQTDALIQEIDAVWERALNAVHGWVEAHPN